MSAEREGLKPVEATIAKLEVSPGDIVVVTLERIVPPDAMERIRVGMERVLPAGVKAMVLIGGMSLSVLKKGAEL